MEDQDHERILPDDNAPTPSQLRKLALVGALSAVRRSRLRRLREDTDMMQERITAGGTNPPIFYASRADFRPSSATEDSVPCQMSGMISARIDEDNEKTWSLKFVDIEHQSSDPARATGERSVYLFEWTRARVKLARRSLQSFSRAGTSGQIDGTDEMDALMNQIDRFKAEDDIAGQWALELEMEEVTAADCQDLLENASNFFGQIDREFFSKDTLPGDVEKIEQNGTANLAAKAMASNNDSWRQAGEDDSIE
ncbi:MAG: hypothetical protein L0H36_01885 [bacterium]|nr:hypothetical protein [bacterium]MDN5835364.1 hypothetical protein [bacterium]